LGWVGISIPWVDYVITGSPGWSLLPALPGTAFVLAGGLLILLLPAYVEERIHETYRRACEHWGEPAPEERRSNRGMMKPPALVSHVIEYLLERLKRGRS
jgi:hypothetical protein